MLKQSFPPIVSPSPRTLILGSLPGDLSLLQQEYYAHPQNRFWKVIFRLFEKDYNINYHNRTQLILEHQLALWDICQSAVRRGSMDTDIREALPNRIDELLESKPSILTIVFNGKKTEQLYKKHFPYWQHIQYHTLPSTSPANAQFTLEKLVEAWRVIR